MIIDSRFVYEFQSRWPWALWRYYFSTWMEMLKIHKNSW